MSGTSLLGQLSELASPQLLDQVSKMTGVDTDLVSKGLGAASGAALGSMANQAGSADGLSSLFDMASKAGAAGASGGSGDPLGGLLSSVLGSGGGGSSDLLGGLLGSALGGSSSAAGATNSIMGPGINAIGSTLSKTLGFNVSPLMNLAAPALMGLVGKSVMGGKLDANGLKSMLTDQSAAFMKDPANAETAKLVKSALDAGQTAVANKDKYTDAGWAVIKAAPVAAAGLVTAASPSDGKAAAAEIAAASGALAKAAGKADPTSILNTAFAEGVSVDDFNAIVGRASSADPIATIKAGLDQVAQGSPGELAAYKALILDTATAAAEASKEGGFLGIGGQQVSTAEQAALDQIKKALA